MQRGVSYTLEEICGPEFWAPLSDLERQLAGKCVALHGHRRAVAIGFVGCKHARPEGVPA